MTVYVLLFNARTENEGVHTYRIQGPEGDTRNIVLMFEAEDDATRFGLMLEAQDFPAPSVERLDRQEIEDFCAQAGYECKLIPDGALITPVEANVPIAETDWQQKNRPETTSPEADSMSASELDRLRRRLENLL